MLLFHSLLWAPAYLTGIVAASPLGARNPAIANRQESTSATPTSAAPSDACARVSASVAAQTKSATATPTVAARLAYECLTSAPHNQTAALRLLDSIKPYIEWQSTVSYLKNPPAEYAEKIQAAVDIWAGIDAIAANVTAGAYQSEFDFGWALYTLFTSAHDGHFSFVPDSIGTIFSWGRPAPLVSVSEDGTKLPAVFVYEDVLATASGNSSFEPSPVTTINGQDAAAYIEDLGRYGTLQDPDALYNSMFYELAQVALGRNGVATGAFAGGGRGRFVYPGPDTTFGFQNGTNRTYENFARVLVPFTNIQSGNDLAKQYFIFSDGNTGPFSSFGVQSDQQDVDSDSTTPSPTVNQADFLGSSSSGTPAPGYPSAVVKHSANLIGGYYLDGDDFSDVAVLNVASFVTAFYDEVEFQQVGQDFIAAAKAAGKSKLVIDVSANGGGTILQGYDLFKQLFPSLLPYGATRFRAHEAANLIGEKYSEVAQGVARNPKLANYTLLGIVASYFNYRSDADVDYKPFDSWEEKYGPHEYNGDNFTSIARWNLSDTLTSYNSNGIQITGYGSRSNFTEQPFRAEDIVIVYDGYCASTCAIFSELMRQQAGIKTIAFGGRPQSAAMQAVGGVKGTNNHQWSYIQSLVSTVYQYSTTDQRAQYGSTEFAGYNNYVPFDRAAAGTYPNSNVRDGLRQGDDSGVPLQFFYEPAECRMYYTAEMTVDITAIWKAAAGAQWGSGGGCVASTSSPSVRKRAITERAKVPSLLARELSLDDAWQSLALSTDLRETRIDVHGFMQP